MTLDTLSRSNFLKSRTEAAHAALDCRIMELRPFSSIEGYARFLCAQFRFHRRVEPLYREPPTAQIVPEGGSGCRLHHVAADLRVLGIEPPRCIADPCVWSPAEAIGWLYVAEGSKLGAAVLLKGVSALGLGANKGASHLAGHPAGRGYEWRRFTKALNALSLSAREDDQAVEGASSAFRFFSEHLELGSKR